MPPTEEHSESGREISLADEARRILETIQWVTESSEVDIPPAIQGAPDSPGDKKTLPVADLELIQRTRIRLMGWRDGMHSPDQRDADMKAFRELEKGQLEWLHLLRCRDSRIGPRGEEGLTEKQRAALAKFQKEGGHAFGLSNEQIDGCQKRGAVLLAELRRDANDNIYDVVGSIATLSQTPFTRGGKLHRRYPQFDLRDIFPQEVREQAYKQAHERIVIWRTTVRNSIGNLNLRRLGIASRLKAVLLHLAKQHKKRRLTHNIGAVYNNRDPDAVNELAVNEPSLAHNSWVHILGLRQQFSTRLLTDHSRTTPTVLKMLWRANDGSIDEGLEAFEGPNGILTRKGIIDLDGVSTERDAARIFEEIDWEERNHMREIPWTSPLSADSE